MFWELSLWETPGVKKCEKIINSYGNLNNYAVLLYKLNDLFLGPDFNLVLVKFKVEWLFSK